MKIKVGVFFGGVSVEHEVSVISALQAINAMDSDRYEPIPIYIGKNKNWYTGEALLEIENYKSMNDLLKQCERITITTDDQGRPVINRHTTGMFGKKLITGIDVAFPVIHGTFGEDGILQGFFELHGIPYVGCDVFSSAVGMDKVMMKQILRDSGLPILDYVWFYSSKWLNEQEALIAKIEAELNYPVIIKPANLGSSVGISKATNREELEEAVELAMEFANKIVAEKMVTSLQEVNCSVLGDYEEAESSICEEVLSSKDILTYQDKYQSGGSSKGGGASKGMESTNRKIPAALSDEKTAQVQALAKETFQTLGCSGVSRIDFLIDKTTDRVYVNEINTIPGSLSFYLWEPTGKSFKELTSDMIQLALKRERERESLTFSVESNLFALHSGGAKGGSKSKIGSNQ
ncbi:D-alanine--D-alanine ligase family protein [Pseudalkalibacillus salsuginis]|uniref:D-alanine--D-alanine ligase family protein n=1 Tax=Pseudalkalibacillus salsuginis TaxID=2910972 RepID=UPI001F1D2FB5|nr:D-alanine--D-alanine ligase family protein [Pseudalkalibacillus salsuginis]MCF6411266.1 D-alanine--D-alanine ligase [Pseudalkalibacillus salsuginis]